MCVSGGEPEDPARDYLHHWIGDLQDTLCMHVSDVLVVFNVSLLDTKAIFSSKVRALVIVCACAWLYSDVTAYLCTAIFIVLVNVSVNNIQHITSTTRAYKD